MGASLYVSNEGLQLFYSVFYEYYYRVILTPLSNEK